MTSPSPTRPHVLTRADLVGEGWAQGRLTRAVGQGRLIRVLPATYAPGETVGALDLVRAARAHFGAEVVAVLGTAAAIQGLPEPWPGDGLVHVALPPGREQHQRPRFRVHTWKLRADERTEIDGVAVTTPGCTVADLMRLSDRLSAVSALDAALHLGVLTVDQAEAAAARSRGLRGARVSRPWWRDADARAESPLETRIRLRATDGGYPPDELQQEFVVDDRRYRTDLAWRRRDGSWLAVEADGRSVHEAPDALLRDRARNNALVSTGDIDLLRFTWSDSVPRLLVPRVLAKALGPARRPRTPRS